MDYFCFLLVTSWTVTYREYVFRMMSCRGVECVYGPLREMFPAIWAQHLYFKIDRDGVLHLCSFASTNLRAYSTEGPSEITWDHYGSNDLLPVTLTETGSFIIFQNESEVNVLNCKKLY